MWSRVCSLLDWEVFVELRREASHVYAVAQRTFNARSRQELARAVSPHQGRSSLRSSVLGFDFSLPPLLDGGGSLVYESRAKVELLSDYFDGKQCHAGVVASILSP